MSPEKRDNQECIKRQIKGKRRHFDVPVTLQHLG